MLTRWLVANYYRQVADRVWQEALHGVETWLRGTADPPVPPAHFRCVLAVGVKWEATPILRALEPAASARYKEGVEYWGVYRDLPLRVVETGMGPQHAAVATRACITRRRPDCVLAIGVAAALKDSLPVGTVFSPLRIVNSDGIDMSGKVADWPLSDQLPAPSGTLVTLDHVLTSFDQRRNVADRYGADAADQESAAIVLACSEEGVACRVVKVIVDAWNDELPRDVQRWLKQKSWAGKLGVLTGALLYRQQELMQLKQWKDRMDLCNRRLAEALGFPGDDNPNPQAP